MGLGSKLKLSKKSLLRMMMCLLVVYLTSFLTFSCSYQYDVHKATNYLTSNANKRSIGLCANYVRRALEEGGCKTWGHPLTAKGYSDFLVDLDFSIVDKKGYKREKGDIVVFNAVKEHPYGHIAMWNGRQWVSDFRQRGLYVAKGYIQSKDFQYYRMTKKHPKRSFRLSHLVMWWLECASRTVINLFK